LTEQPEDLNTSYEYANYASNYRVAGRNVNLVGETVLPYIYKKEIYVFSVNPTYVNSVTPTITTSNFNYFPYRDMINTDHPYCQNYVRYSCLENYDPAAAPGAICRTVTGLARIPIIEAGSTIITIPPTPFTPFTPILRATGWPAGGTACQDYGNC